MSKENWFRLHVTNKTEKHDIKACFVLQDGEMTFDISGNGIIENWVDKWESILTDAGPQIMHIIAGGRSQAAGPTDPASPTGPAVIEDWDTVALMLARDFGGADKLEEARGCLRQIIEDEQIPDSALNSILKLVIDHRDETLQLLSILQKALNQ